MSRWIRDHLYWGGSWKYGVWTVRIKQSSLQLKAPWNSPLFSERYGLKTWIIRFRGWRLIFDNRRK